MKSINYKTSFILCLFFGYIGIHKFYEKKYVIGILYIFTFGLFLIGWIYDIFYLYNKYKSTCNNIKDSHPNKELFKEIETQNNNKIDNLDTSIGNVQNKRVSIKSFTFKVAGITFQNDDNQNIQNLIKNILNEYKKSEYFNDDLYGGYSNKEIIDDDLQVFEYENIILYDIEIIPSTFNNELCYKVYLPDINKKFHHIGYIPKNLINEYQQLANNFQPNGCHVHILGGKYKHVVYDFEKDKNTIEIVDKLSYGIEVSLFFK